MTRIRCRLRAVAVYWLYSQLALLTGSAVVLASASADVACTCTQGVMCPMHQTRPQGSPRCGIQSAKSNPAVSTAWVGTPGLIASATLAIASAPARDVVQPRSLAVFGSSPRPESPPPRV
jgi:hypothetical protein